MFVQFIANSLIVSLIIKATALLLAAFALNFLFRSCSSALRHFVWATTVVLLLLLPVMSTALPPLDVVDHYAPRTVVQPSQITPVAPISHLPAPTQPPAEHVAISDSGAVAPPLPASAAHKQPLKITDAALSQPSFNASRHWRDILAAAWFAGFMFSLLPVLKGLATTGKTIRSAVSADPDLAAIAGEVISVLRIRPIVTVKVAELSSGLDVPITWGVLRPVVLLPAMSSEWSKEKLRAALTHEVSHIARKDWFFQIVSTIVCAIYWFHPLVWLASKQLRRESEHASDDLVIESGFTPSDYAQALLEIARALPVRSPRNYSYSAAIAMAQPSELTPRMTAILQKLKNRRPMTIKSASAFFGIFALCSAALAAVHLVQYAQTSSAQTSSDAKIEVVAISSGATPGPQWWDSRGNLLPSKPLTATNPKPTTDPWLSNYTYYMKASNVTPDAHVIVQSDGTVDTTSYSTSAVNGTIQIEQIEARPRNGSKADLRIGIASGPWQEMKVVRHGDLNKTFSGEDPVVGTYSFTLHPTVPAISGSNLLLTRSLSSRLLFRCVIAQTSGQTTTSTSDMLTDRWSFNHSVMQLGVPEKDIKEVRLEYTPYRFYPVTGIPLHPGALAANTSAESLAADQCLSLIAQGLQHPGQVRDEIPLLRAAVAADPSSPDAHYQLANALYNSNLKVLTDISHGSFSSVYVAPSPAERDEAIKQMSEALSIWPNNYQWHIEYAGYLASAGHHQAAIAQYQIALKEIGHIAPVDMAKPHPADIFGKAGAYTGMLYGLGDELVRDGKYRQAVAPLQELMLFNWDPEVTELDLGKAFIGCGRKADALAVWKKSAAITSPTDYYGRQARTMLAKYDRS